MIHNKVQYATIYYRYDAVQYMIRYYMIHNMLKYATSYMMRYDFIHDTTGYATQYDTL